jgi:hypothetical protein
VLLPLALSLPPHVKQNWPMLALGAALLLFPLPLLYGKGVHYRELKRSWDRYVKCVLQLPWHWIDLIRGAAGTLVLMDALEVTRRLNPPPDKVSALILMAVIVCAVVIQTVACKAEDGFNAPFGFTAAAILPLYPPIMAGLVLIVVVAIARAVRSGGSFFGVQAFAILAIGAFLYPALPLLAVGAAASLPPLILPLLFQRELMLAHRAVTEEVLPAHR